MLLPNAACEFSIVKTIDGRLSSFGGMPAPEQFSVDDPPLMFTGIQILEPGYLTTFPFSLFAFND